MTLPNFLIIGAAKTGTTSVDRRRELLSLGGLSRMKRAIGYSRTNP